jgi:arylsulfatase
LRGGQLTTFEGGVRMPCVMRWPGHVPAGRVTAELGTTMDLFVTLAKLGGAPLPKLKLDGIDLTALVLGEAGARGRSTFWYYSGEELQAVRQGIWKLHLPHEYLTVAAAPGHGGKPSNFENMQPRAIEESGIRGIASRHGYRVESMPLSLFNLEEDPGETRDVAAKYPRVVEQLQKVAAAARADLGDALTIGPRPGVRPAGVAP